MDKQILVDQIREQLSHNARIARTAADEAAHEARFGATPGDKRHDARIALEYSQLAHAQSRRTRTNLAAIDALDGFHPRPLGQRDRIDLGAIVEIEDGDTGEGRTFFLAPVGAGLSLTGPGGDGWFTVVTPASPIGRAVLGRRVHDVVDVTVRGELREWTITFVC